MNDATLRDDSQIEANRETQLQRLAIRLFAILLIVIGVGSIFAMISRFAQEQFYLDFGFFGIFIGRGLLMRKDLWRIWALVVSWLGVASGLLCMVLLAFGMGPMQVKLGDLVAQIDMLPALVVCTVIIIYFGWQLFVLTRLAVKKTFTPEGRPNDWWRPIAVASLFLCVSLMVLEWAVNKEHNSLASYHTEIETIDAESGKVINPIVCISNINRTQRFPTFNTQTSDGDRLVLYGICNKPFTIYVSSEGYREKEVQLENANTDFIRVELEKLPPTDTQHNDEHKVL